MKTTKLKVSQITYGQIFLREFTTYFLVPSVNRSGANELIYSAEDLQNWQALFLAKFGDLLLSFDNYQGFTCGYYSRAKKMHSIGCF